MAGPGQIRNLQVEEEPLPGAVTDPIFHARYSSAIAGRVFQNGRWRTRFLVYYQGAADARARDVADLLCRFYWYGQVRLQPYGAFNSPQWSEASDTDTSTAEDPVPFFLDNSQPAGGREIEGRLYMLQASAPRHPLEVVREVAHEFSHLTIPGIRGFDDPRAPEDWTNGYLGEVLYMEWLGQDPSQHVVPASQVADWSAARSRVLETAFLKLGPGIVQREAPQHFWELEGMLLYVKQMYGVPLLAHILRVCTDSRRQSAAYAALNLADSVAADHPDRAILPGSLAIRPGSAGLAPARSEQEFTLAVGDMARTWIYLPAGYYRLRANVEGANWRLRAAEIRSPTDGVPLGMLTPQAPELAFQAPGQGWYEVQWRSLGVGPAVTRGWEWRRGKK